MRTHMTDYEIREGARKTIFRNMIKGRKKDGRYFHYTKPSPERYPYQFFWDTCFHVFILAALDEYEMAKEHIKSLFALQENDGFVGHMIYWNRVIPGQSAAQKKDPTLCQYIRVEKRPDSAIQSNQKSPGRS